MCLYVIYLIDGSNKCVDDYMIDYNCQTLTYSIIKDYKSVCIIPLGVVKEIWCIDEGGFENVYKA